MSLLQSNKLVDRYTLGMLKKHTPYISALIIFLLIAFTVIPYQSTDYLDEQKKLTETKEEVAQLKVRLETVKKYSQVNLNDYSALVNALYPDVEDRFSIFNAIDAFLPVYGMFITKYTSPFASALTTGLEGNPGSRITIPIQAEVPEDQMVSFLNSYSYKTGRLLTISQVIYVPPKNSLSFTASFHSGQVEGDHVAIDDSIISLAEKIKTDILSVNPLFGQSKPVENIPIDYTSKQDPFNGN